MRIGFLGLGNMGTPMALRLISAGHELSVWNRSEGNTTPVIHEGAIAAGTPAEAELGADAVITMLFDDHAYEQVVFGSNGLMDALSPGGLHISCSTISPTLSERLAEEYANRAVDFVAAPVFGNPTLAEAGQLWVCAAGADKAVDRTLPLLETFSRGITVVGKEPRQAHAVRLGGSFLLSAMMVSLSEAFVFATQQGVDPEAFFQAVNDGLFQSPAYGRAADGILHPHARRETSIEVAAKDLRLLRQAMGIHHTGLSLAPLMAEIHAEAQRIGLSGQSCATTHYQMAQHRGSEKQ